MSTATTVLLVLGLFIAYQNRCSWFNIGCPHIRIPGIIDFRGPNDIKLFSDAKFSRIAI